MGLEPTIFGTTIRRVNQLRYTHHIPFLSRPKGGSAAGGTPGGTRTPGPLLRRQLLYPPELQAHMERVMGIEPTRPAWKAGILPLNYTRRRCLRKCQLWYDTTVLAACQSPQTKKRISPGKFYAKKGVDKPRPPAYNKSTNQ